MSASAVVIVLLAAVLHATWNTVVKTSADGLLAAWAVGTTAAVVNIPVLAVVGLPDADVWWMIGLSSAIHVAYNLTLATAYSRADLSVAYPIARGSAPLLVTLVGALALGDPTPLAGVAGVILVSLSLVVLARRRPLRHTTWAVITGLMIAGYTVLDGAGVRENGDSIQYISAVFVFHAIPFLFVVIRLRGVRPMVQAIAYEPARLLIGGVAAAVAYLLVMIAARTEPLGLVAGLRETSALFAVLIGALILGEPVTSRHTLAVIAGVVGTVAIATT